jgi:hypothetical protein
MLESDFHNSETESGEGDEMARGRKPGGGHHNSRAEPPKEEVEEENQEEGQETHGRIAPAAAATTASEAEPINKSRIVEEIVRSIGDVAEVNAKRVGELILRDHGEEVFAQFSPTILSNYTSNAKKKVYGGSTGGGGDGGGHTRVARASTAGGEPSFSDLMRAKQVSEEFGGSLRLVKSLVALARLTGDTGFVGELAVELASSLEQSSE